jgi:hypothetical protein
MGRLLRLGVLTWLAVAMMVPAQAQGTGKDSVARTRKGKAQLRQQVKKQLDRLSDMPVDERSKVLERLPPERRRMAERRLDMYQKLSPEERERLAEGWERFTEKTPAQQAAIRRLFRKFSELPVDRRPMIRQELMNLRQLSGDDRRARINTDEFRNKYSLAEQQLLADLSAALAAEPELSAPGSSAQR